MLLHWDLDLSLEREFIVGVGSPVSELGNNLHSWLPDPSSQLGRYSPSSQRLAKNSINLGFGFTYSSLLQRLGTRKHVGDLER